MVKITEEAKKVGKGVYLCECCLTYQSEHVNAKKRFIKWDICNRCHELHFDASKKKERTEIRKKKRDIKRRNAYFNLRFDKAGDITPIIEALSSLLDECHLIFSRDGLLLEALDPSRISFTTMQLSPKYFNEYEYTVENQYFDLNLDSLNTIIKTAVDSSEVKLSNQDEKSKIRIGMESQVFILNSLDHLDDEFPGKNLSHIEYPCKFVMDPSKLLDILTKAEIFSEVITFEIEGNEIQMRAEATHGMFYDTIKIKKPSESDFIVGYSIKFIKNILEPLIPILKKMELHLKADNPLKINFFFEKESKIHHYTAPRVEGPEDYDEEEEL